jgi:hypothetical protein
MAARSAVGPGDAARPCANWLGRIDSTPKVRATASSMSAGARATAAPPQPAIAGSADEAPAALSRCGQVARRGGLVDPAPDLAIAPPDAARVREVGLQLGEDGARAWASWSPVTMRPARRPPPPAACPLPAPAASAAPCGDIVASHRASASSTSISFFGPCTGIGPPAVVVRF